MATKKDMRRTELIVPYKDPSPEKSEGGDLTSTMTTTLPMVALFTRNKMIGWSSFLFAVQNWLAQTPDQIAKSSTPAWMSVGMSFMAVATTYMTLFLPPPPTTQSTGTGPPAAAPPS